MPGQAAVPGLPGSRARALSLRGWKTQPASEPFDFFFLTHEPRCLHRTASQGTETWTCRAGAQPCFSRVVSEAAGSTGVRDKGRGWEGFGRKTMSGFAKRKLGGFLV